MLFYMILGTLRSIIRNLLAVGSDLCYLKYTFLIMKTAPLDLTGSQLKALILSHGWYTLDPFSARTDPPPFLSVGF